MQSRLIKDGIMLRTRHLCLRNPAFIYAQFSNDWQEGNHGKVKQFYHYIQTPLLPFNRHAEFHTVTQ